jgi:Kef-type K+ transport system membrane component KefB
MALWLVLFVKTGNWILASIATLTSLWVLFIIFGIAAFSQWSLGVIESVVLVLVVPLSAIPIAMLTLAFGRTHTESRREQIRVSLAETGPSILFGTCDSRLN